MDPYQVLNQMSLKVIGPQASVVWRFVVITQCCSINHGYPWRSNYETAWTIKIPTLDWFYLMTQKNPLGGEWVSGIFEPQNCRTICVNFNRCFWPTTFKNFSTREEKPRGILSVLLEKYSILKPLMVFKLINSKSVQCVSSFLISLFKGTPTNVGIPLIGFPEKWITLEIARSPAKSSWTVVCTSLQFPPPQTHKILKRRPLVDGRRYDLAAKLAKWQKCWWQPTYKETSDDSQRPNLWQSRSRMTNKDEIL